MRSKNGCFILVARPWRSLLATALKTLGMGLFTLATPMIFAADNSAKAGLLYGFSVPDAQNTNPYGILGFKGSAYITPTFSTGGYFLFSDKRGAPSADDKFRYSLHGVNATYHMPKGSGDTYIGLRIGITKINANPNGVDSTFSPYHYGVATGYDYDILPYISIGFEGSYLHVQNGKTTQNGTTVQLPSFNIMSFMLSLQFIL
jgi:hypothetical protein